MNKRWSVFVLLVLLAGLAVAPVQADGPATRAERAEVRFLEGMIDHHQMALDMAADCLAKASSEPVVMLCQGVIDAQSAEIETMRGWLLNWYGITYAPVSMVGLEIPMSGHSHTGTHGGGAMSDPPMMMGMMAGLNALAGTEYEIAWLEAMIDHHDDALHMSERILNVTERAELRDLAEGIIEAQSAEIEIMEAMIDELGGESM